MVIEEIKIEEWKSHFKKVLGRVEDWRIRKEGEKNKKGGEKEEKKVGKKWIG